MAVASSCSSSLEPSLAIRVWMLGDSRIACATGESWSGKVGFAALEEAGGLALGPGDPQSVV